MIMRNYKIETKPLARLIWRHKELFIWIAAMVMLYNANLYSDFTLCIPSNLGFKNCPGCGVGHAVTAAMHGDWSQSWQYHILGIPTLTILSLHIIKLIKNLTTEIQQYYGQ